MLQGRSHLGLFLLFSSRSAERSGTSLPAKGWLILHPFGGLVNAANPAIKAMFALSNCISAEARSKYSFPNSASQKPQFAYQNVLLHPGEPPNADLPTFTSPEPAQKGCRKGIVVLGETGDAPYSGRPRACRHRRHYCMSVTFPSTNVTFKPGFL